MWNWSLWESLKVWKTLCVWRYIVSYLHEWSNNSALKLFYLIMLHILKYFLQLFSSHFAFNQGLLRMNELYSWLKCSITMVEIFIVSTISTAAIKDVFRNQPKATMEIFWENNDRLLAVNYFCEKSLIVDVQLGSRYASDYNIIAKNNLRPKKTSKIKPSCENG